MHLFVSTLSLGIFKGLTSCNIVLPDKLKVVQQVLSLFYSVTYIGYAAYPQIFDLIAFHLKKILTCAIFTLSVSKIYQRVYAEYDDINIQSIIPRIRQLG